MLGRCYIPKNYLNGNELKHLVNDRNPDQIPNGQLKRYAEKMLDIADNFANQAIGAVNLLPDECRRAVLSALEIYQGIGKQIRSNSHYERRTFLSKSEKIRIVFKCMYFTSLASLNDCGKRKG